MQSLLLRAAAVLAVLVIGAGGLATAASPRLKDIAKVEGIRENQLIGYGLVVGLTGTGDRLQNTPFTERSLTSMLERLGVAISSNDLRTRNVAAVIVTASLPGFSRAGDRIDVSVSALGDASSLRGGTLLVTPLTAADGNVYAVAQGSLLISGFSVEGAAASVTKGVPTAGRIPNGATVERDLTFPVNELRQVRYILKNPDFTTARRAAEAIDARLGGAFAKVLDLATIEIQVPQSYRGAVSGLLAEIEDVQVRTDDPARVVVDESSGTIVIGANVRISQVAVTHGNITIQVREAPVVSQPQPFSRNGETVALPRTQIAASEGGAATFQVIEGSASLQDLVNGLNALGVPPRDVIAILQSIKSAGALHAELVVQ